MPFRCSIRRTSENSVLIVMNATTYSAVRVEWLEAGKSYPAGIWLLYRERRNVALVNRSARHPTGARHTYCLGLTSKVWKSRSTNEPPVGPLGTSSHRSKAMVTDGHDYADAVLCDVAGEP